MSAMAFFGEYLLKGVRGPSKKRLRLFYTGRAVQGGSPRATYMVGEGFLVGRDGLPQDSAEAKHHIGKVAEGKCEFNDLHEAEFEQAKQLFERLS